MSRVDREQLKIVGEYLAVGQSAVLLIEAITRVVDKGDGLNCWITAGGTDHFVVGWKPLEVLALLTGAPPDGVVLESPGFKAITIENAGDHLVVMVDFGVGPIALQGSRKLGDAFMVAAEMVDAGPTTYQELSRGSCG